MTALSPQDWQALDRPWVFAYGSLMWNPGFDYVEKIPVTLYGAHRSFCVSSVHWRGTPERPGLVLGLDRGGACCGVAYRVRPAQAQQVRAYLIEREQVTLVYQEAVRPVRARGCPPFPALSFLVDQTHDQYAGKLSHPAQAAIIARGHGVGGSNLAYLQSTLDHLAKLGLRDHGLDAVMARIKTR